MPFIKRLNGLITPKRVCSLCKLAQCQKCSKAELKNLLEPENLKDKENKNKDKFTDIFNFSKPGN